LAVVDKAYDKLTETLGNNWQKEYIVWDMCCGVGNLEVKHSNPRNIFMSTLDSADVDVMKATKSCVAATRFQYDYLNDDITDDGQIDYTLTNKIPESLRKAISDGKKILVLINPPYGEAGSTDTISGGKHKTDIATTKIASQMEDYGYATRELFTQFIARISVELPTATIAMFSKLKYINAPNFENFRKLWYGEYLGGFFVHSKSFEGLKGEFPIGFLIWETSRNPQHKNKIVEITADVLDRSVNPIGEKTFYNIASENFLSEWIKRPRSNKTDSIPLKNAVTPATVSKDLRGNRWADGAIGSMLSNSNMLQNASTLTAIFSSGFGSAGAFFITKDNLWQVAIVFSVRRLIKPTWLNDRDQFLKPTQPLPEEFKTDCLIWMLFNGSNLTASANGLEWNGKKWSIVNHFIPFTEVEVNATERFESDFMVQYLAGKLLSNEAQQVLPEGKKLWQAYFAHTDLRTVRDELKLNRADVGWYQIRKVLQARNSSGDFPVVSFTPFEEAYKALTEKLQPLVYELGFLRN
jgi:predicted RNA methylase